MSKHYVLKHKTRKLCVVSKDPTWPRDPGFRKHKTFDSKAEATKWIDDNCDVTC